MSYLEDIKQKTKEAIANEAKADQEFLNGLIDTVKDSIEEASGDGISITTIPLAYDIDTVKYVRNYFTEMGFEAEFEAGDKAYILTVEWK